MPRANRHFLPGHVWHITHRVTKKFVQNVPIVQPLRSVQAVEEGEPRELPLLSDRVIGAVICTGFSKQRSGSVYRCSYAVTSNHIHLLVKDTGPNVIAQSMQLIAGRTAQEYNQRRARGGAFWEDRYHATAIEIDEHLVRCLGSRAEGQTSMTRLS